MDGTREITNAEDMIDSRDVIARIEYLADDDYERDEDEDRELAALRALADQGENDAEDWQYGASLIRETYFVDYVKGYAEDTSEDGKLIDKWPYSHIDWDAAAEELQTDYTEFMFDGVTYYAR